MECSKCQFQNPDGSKFCVSCGSPIEVNITCTKCGTKNLKNYNFCNKCGHNLRESQETSHGERKHVTVLFSDMSGYTSMSEKLDPEEVKEITSKIFGEAAKIISKYEGFVEKYIGDAVVAIFGATKSFEDDPIRAIKAATEIHKLIVSHSPKYETKVDQPLFMHTGINTGLVVTGEVDLEKGTHGIAGETINIAARLSGLASPDEILVSHDTYCLVEGYFNFKEIESVKVKGKKKQVRPYKLLSAKIIPNKIHRLHGLRADLIGRTTEMAQLEDAIRQLMKGNGSIISICGDAGTGKSRLVEEFKATLNLEKIQWREGHAYAYSKNSPYTLVIDLLNRAFRIEEGDSIDEVKEKVESGIESLVRNKGNIIPYIGGLFSLSYPEIEEVSPEFWKAQLHKAIGTFLSALAQRAPTIICLEDLHWADPSSIDLIRFILTEYKHPVLFLCVYRPSYSLFQSHQLSAISQDYTEIRLQDLSPSETQNMIHSLLKSEAIPSELKKFIQYKIEGNPFYLEEVINSLIEAKILVRDNSGWKLTQIITKASIPSTIQGILAARLDRLENDTKRILQEASVIGRAFFYEILKTVTDFKDQIEGSLNNLERLDLIRERSIEPDLEYIFKHALTQEAVYNGLLKKDCRMIHERIGQAMEQLFSDRLVEFYEILSYHYSRGQSLLKAVDYLSKSGEKSLKRFALEEAHNYYQEAFNLINSNPENSKMEKELMVRVLLKWALVFNHRGDFKGLNEFLVPYENMAEALNDKQKLGMFYAWLGFTTWMRGKPRIGYDYLIKALSLGEEIKDYEVLGYACTWLGWVCYDLGLLKEGIDFGERAQDIQKKHLKENHYLHFSALGAIGQICSATGDAKRAFETATTHFDYGQRYSIVRSTVFGHIDMGFGHFVTGNFPSAIESFLQAIKISPDPFFITYARFWLGASYLLQNRVDDAEVELKQVLNFSRTYGTEVFEPSNIAFLGVVEIVKERLSKGLKMLEDGVQKHKDEGRKSLYALLEHTLGKVYLQIAQGEGPKSLSFMIKNIGFLVKNVPYAAKKAEEHFTKSIKVSREIGANYSLALALMDIGTLHKLKKRTHSAIECITEAVEIFEQCEAEIFLKQAKGELASLL